MPCMKPVIVICLFAYCEYLMTQTELEIQNSLKELQTNSNNGNADSVDLAIIASLTNNESTNNDGKIVAAAANARYVDLSRLLKVNNDVFLLDQAPPKEVKNFVYPEANIFNQTVRGKMAGRNAAKELNAEFPHTSFDQIKTMQREKLKDTCILVQADVTADEFQKDVKDLIDGGSLKFCAARKITKN